MKNVELIFITRDVISVFRLVSSVEESVDDVAFGGCKSERQPVDGWVEMTHRPGFPMLLLLLSSAAITKLFGNCP